MSDLKRAPASTEDRARGSTGVDVRAGAQDQQAAWLSEFSLLVNTGKDYFSIFLKAFGFYLAAVGAVLKFFFDAPERSNERVALFAFGALLNAAAILATVLGHAGIDRWLPVVRRSEDSLGFLKSTTPGRSAWHMSS
jgi:hypothetical protein